MQVVAALVAGGVGLPVPEELALMSAGYFLARGVVGGPAMFAAALGAMLAGDGLLYLAGRTGLRLGGARARTVARGLVQVERAFARHGGTLILVGRFVPGVRATLLVAAGAARMPLGRLVACDGAAALVGAALWIALGWHLGPQLARARAIVGVTRSVLLVAALVAAAIVVAWRVRRPRRMRRDALAREGS